MKRILLPTDFSKNSINAIDYAMEMFKDEPCHFYVLNVQKASSFISADLMVVNSSATIYTTIVDAAKKSINNITARIKKQYHNDKHEFESIVDYDNFIDAINEVTTKYHIDLIVMGTKGASGFAKVFFGSNTVKVIQRCHVPVLAIPENCVFSNLDKIGFTTSFDSLYKTKDLLPLTQLLNKYNSKLYILHAVGENNFAEEMNRNIDFFKSNFKDSTFQYLHVADKDVYKTIYQYSTKNDIKMIALCVCKHSFFERLFNRHTFEDIAFSINIPFLVMKNTMV
ncbi:MAG: universal stress protein [Confluentibacter sp.]|jgi:nucleotide-binding universal stress UspA family protein|nr:universal stress protein [Confluentibacter sp.]HMQ45406.1 universal stress protein [Mariniflexile sp.]HMR15238.1 universal stress protein [Mariniflexile sp.]